MLPSISNILNPSDSPRSNHHVDRPHQLPTLLPPLVHSTPTPPTANPIHVPVHGQPRLPSPAEILNLPNATVPAHAHRSVCPIACYNGQPIEAARGMFPVPFDNRYQLVYSEKRAYPFYYTNRSQTAVPGSFSGHSINVGAAATVNAATHFNPVSNATNAPSGIEKHPAIPFALPIRGCITPNATVIRAQQGILTPSVNPEHDTSPIFLPQAKNIQNRVGYQNLPHDIQHLSDQSRSIHQTPHPQHTANGQPSSTGSTHPESDSSSPDVFITPQTQVQTGTQPLISVPISSGERLFPSMEELEFRKFHFSHNVYPPTFPFISSKKRSRSNALLSYQRNEQENAGSDSNPDKELHCKRIKIIKSPHPATEPPLNFSNSSLVYQNDSSPGSENCSFKDNQRHLDPSGFGDRSHGNRQVQRPPPKYQDSPSPGGHEHGPRPISDNASPEEGQEGAESFHNSRRTVLRRPSCCQRDKTGATDQFVYDHCNSQNISQKELIAPSQEASSPKKRCDQRKRYISEPSTSGHTSNNGVSVKVSHSEAESDEAQPNQTPTEVNHTFDVLIMQASMVENTYKCDECSATFANEDSITRHKRAQHTIATRASQMVKCPECTLLLRNKQNLKRHLATHGPNANHKCIECTAKFVTERARTTHMRDVHKRKAEQRSVRDRSTRCPVTGCSYASNQKTNVKRHYENKHLNIKRFHCTFPSCDYIGSTRANRQAHMKIHEKETKNVVKISYGNDTKGANGSDDRGYIEDGMDIQVNKGDKTPTSKREDSEER